MDEQSDASADALKLPWRARAGTRTTDGRTIHWRETRHGVSRSQCWPDCGVTLLWRKVTVQRGLRWTACTPIA